MPPADRTAPTVSNRLPGSAGSGSFRRHDRRLQQERGAPADRGGDQPADQRSGGGADAAHPADHAEGTRPRLGVVEVQRGEYVDRRDHQRRADALKGRVAEDQHPEPRREGGDHGPGSVNGQTQVQAPFAPPFVGQLAARDHQRGHGEQEQRDRRLHAVHRGPQVLGDAVDRHVHVRAREARHELSQGQRRQRPASDARDRTRRRGQRCRCRAHADTVAAPAAADITLTG